MCANLERMKNHISDYSKFLAECINTTLKKDSIRKGFSWGLLAFWCVNGGLLCELIFKYIYAKQKGTFPQRSHSLESIYSQLDPPKKYSIFENYKRKTQVLDDKIAFEKFNQILQREGITANLQKFKCETQEEFEELLKEVSNVFVEFRYFYEKNRYDTHISGTFISILISALLKEAEILIDFPVIFLEFIPDNEGNYFVIN